VKCVIDASVAAKIFIAEEHSDKAMEIIEAHVRGYLLLSAPTLLLYELGNVFWKHPQIAAEKAYTFIKRFVDLQLNFVNIYSDNDLLRNVCHISKSRDVTFYDATYVAIAERDETKLITADEEILNKAPEITLLLKEYKSQR